MHDPSGKDQVYMYTPKQIQNDCGLKLMRFIHDIPKRGTSFGEVKHLSRVQQPLERLQEAGTLVTTTLGVNEDQ